ncbi:hypothetical protein FIL92_01070 [SAR202 cluster bacterium AD-812-D07_MRT_10900m]|nr:hypothetical protein [SAR202 cluster bacterium AD-812-D07_MRT_10900m]
MVAEPKPEPFITIELFDLVRSLEGVIHKPSSIHDELKEMKHWLKVELNDRDDWKKPFYYMDGEKGDQWFRLSSYQRDLYEVLDQEPLSKGGVYAGDRIFAIDIDDVIDPVTLVLKEPKILDLINYLKAPVYLSSSGKGIHILGKFQEGVVVDAPSFNLSYRETEGKTGQFLGGNYPNFVAFTGVVVPPYDFPGFPAVNQEEWEWIREFLWSEETRQQYREPSEPETLANPVPEPQTRALRESEPNNEPFGIKWKPNYRTHVKNMMYGVDEPTGNVDTSISGWVFNWIKTYIRGAEEPTCGGAVELSIRAEGYRLKKQRPGIKQRTNKPEKWHQGNATNAWLELADSGELVVLGKGEKIGKTSAEDQLLQAVKHAQSVKMKPSTEKIFLQIVASASGRDRYKLTNRKIAEVTGLNARTVKRAKAELAQHDCLKIEGRKYILRLDNQCSPTISE